jgi:hypothetical protein
MGFSGMIERYDARVKWRRREAVQCVNLTEVWDLWVNGVGDSWRRYTIGDVEKEMAAQLRGGE